MLLDVSPIGYESVAMWDEMQCRDMHDMLAKLVDLQPENAKRYHAVIYNYYLHKLEDAVFNGKPIRKIISTQVIGLPALCDAIAAHNIRIEMKHFGDHVAPFVVIEQFMTDLPTIGAVYYFNSLKSLSEQQQQQMNIHAVNLERGPVKTFFSRQY